MATVQCTNASLEEEEQIPVQMQLSSIQYLCRQFRATVITPDLHCNTDTSEKQSVSYLILRAEETRFAFKICLISVLGKSQQVPGRKSRKKKRIRKGAIIKYPMCITQPHDAF